MDMRRHLPRHCALKQPAFMIDGSQADG